MAEIHELRFTAQRLRNSREDVKKEWKAKVEKKEKELKQEEANTLHA